MLPDIGLFDVCLGGVYLFIIYFIAFRTQHKKPTIETPFKYFIIALSAKVTGAIAFILLSIFYFKSGDTFLYYEIAEELRTHLFSNPSETLNLLITPYADLKTLDYHPLQVYNYYFERSSTWAFSKIVFFFNLISFGSYLVSSILMGFVSFLGLWLGYRSLAKCYPSSAKLLLIPFFGIPTALIWSSGMLKDTLLMGVIGFLLFIGINIFIKKESLFLHLIYFFCCLLVLISLKPILVFVFIPCFLFWGALHLTAAITPTKQKLIVRLVAIALIFGSTVLISSQLPSTSKYKLANLQQTLIGFQVDHANNKKANTTYTLGTTTHSTLGIIKKIPKAINVTFFRPYLWEANNTPTLLAAIESFVLLFLLLFVLFKAKLTGFKIIFSDKNVLFFFSFGLIYAVITGLTAYNFGALSRFKIPAVMFFCLGMIILLNRSLPGFLKEKK